MSAAPPPVMRGVGDAWACAWAGVASDVVFFQYVYRPISVYSEQISPGAKGVT